MDVGSQETPSDDFGFAFNQVMFSDSVLRIEIVPDPSGSGAETDDSLADWVRNRPKRRRVDQITNSDETVEIYKENNLNHSAQDELSCEYHLDRLRPWLMTDMVPAKAPKDLENAPDVIVSGRGTAQEPETSSNMSEVQVKTIHISSPILAVKSPFFYKLLSNGERDSEQRHVTLRIRASEEDALMDLLKFIYCNRSTTRRALLDVLMAADEFEVASCMRYCSQLLQNLPMSRGSALVYLYLPSMLRMTDAVKPLIDAAKKFHATRFKDINKCEEEVLNLPLLGFEAVVSSDDLQVASEDVIYRLILNWAQKHYPELHDRREILSTRLIRYIRFPYMSCPELKNVLECRDIEATSASKAVVDALFHKAQSPFKDHSSGGRAYNWRPIKVMELEAPRQQRVCYLDLTRGECARLFPSSSLYSQPFRMGGHEFYLCGECCEENSLSLFGLFLGMRGGKEGSASLTIDYQFASRAKESLDFVTQIRINKTFTGGMCWGTRNLFGVPWNVFIADDSPYFIDGVLHLRAEFTVTKV